MSMRQYPSGAKKRDIRKKRKAEDAKNEGALLTFLAKRPVTPSSETTQTEITAGNQSAVVSATASMDSESYPTELPESEPPAKGSIEVASIETVDNCSEILTDIAMWPANLTETMRNYVLDFKPKNVGDFSCASMLMTDRGRQYFRHLSEHNFYLTKANGQKERRDRVTTMLLTCLGLQARIKAHSPNAVYIPCSSHSLNLRRKIIFYNTFSKINFDVERHISIYKNVSTIFLQCHTRTHQKQKYLRRLQYTQIDPSTPTFFRLRELQDREKQFNSHIDILFRIDQQLMLTIWWESIVGTHIHILSTLRFAICILKTSLLAAFYDRTSLCKFV
ncbi:hypothetical protein HELRODRAFT_169223 [Helobdella robusta]|uniref:Uncharacterized protein n=1 Tax=Helobdella robusta TaxID=6412 RepID=T1F1L3_HELRO|nr:hypothetical protein HELRODRAFT_169223 [Helobdella robusta]ESO08392.1 hypothetical protein HELRODRAFT_169223 [Helobdella robusta]